MKFCKHCGAQLKDEAQFCPKCGKPQSDIPAAPAPQAAPPVYTQAPATQQPQAYTSAPNPAPAAGGGMNNAIMALVAVVVVFVGGACFWMYQQSNKPAAPAKPAATTQQAAQTVPAATTQPAAQPAPAPAPAPAAAAPVPSNEVPAAGNTGVITGVDVRIRSGAGTDAAILGYFDKGERVAILQTVEGWYKVRRYNGAVGWVSADFCAR